MDEYRNIEEYLNKKKNNNNFEVAFFIDSPVLPINNVVEKK